MRFVKTEALGNDFLLVEERDAGGVDRGALARRICDRRRGLGADGLIFFARDESGRTSMKLLNSDGSPSEMSGNGLRCLAAYLTYSGRITASSFTISTDAGEKSLDLVEAGGRRFRFRTDLGRPGLASTAVPFAIDPPAEPVVRAPLDLDGETLHVTALNVGNPQCIVFAEKLDRSELLRLGPRIESHPRFPRKTNFELVEVLGPREIAIGIWERGAGETAASGTGSAASVVAAVLNGRTEEQVTVHCPGGDLEVDWKDRRSVFLTGEAVVVAEGDYLA